MKNLRMVKIILLISGLTSVLIGSGILFAPFDFFGINGIVLSNDSSLLNEIRPLGGMLLASGVLIMLGAFIPKLTFTSILISILLYFSYVGSRLFSIVMDGVPAEGLLVSLAVELLLGCLGVIALIQYRSGMDKNIVAIAS